ncbi:Transcriptional regulator, LysR family (fragment) [Mesorhizobium metallidurans STM 2683]|uniref:Transcriptional regulator, LysR family n=1 Tax=Mesorhizobium metallidurans STM 2683 TaxID=1297569 RepID=M5EMN9_9HYPH
MTTLAGLVAAGGGLGFVTAGMPEWRDLASRTVQSSLPMAAAWREPALSASDKHFLEVVATLSAEKNTDP